MNRLSTSGVEPSNNATTRGLVPGNVVRSSAFVPLVLDNMHTAAGITLELRGGRALRLSESFPFERLAGLILALEAEGRT